jgi:protein-arginine kinase activator protein McsA
VLDQLVEELKDKAPPEEREIVRDRLQRAVAEENYERAAQLRDLLRSMEE